jgi:thiol:disulfide interchange protein
MDIQRKQRTTRWDIAATVFGVVMFLTMAVWWLESRFDKSAVIMVIGGLFGILCFAGGALLNHMNARAVLQNVVQFVMADAQVDRYRMLSVAEHSKGETAWHRAAAQMQVLDAKRIERMADERARIMVDTEMQKRAAANAWGVEEGVDDDGNFVTFD